MWFRSGDVFPRRFVFSEDPIQTESKPGMNSLKSSEEGSLHTLTPFCLSMFGAAQVLGSPSLGLVPQCAATSPGGKHWCSPLSWAKILHALKSTVWDIRGFVSTFLAYSWSLSLIWRQIFPATSLSLLTPGSILLCPALQALHDKDAGEHRLSVHRQTKLCWVIRTRHTWLSSYQPNERKTSKQTNQQLK